MFWSFNPPFNSNIRTKVGKKCLSIVYVCFPKGSEWYPFFNRHTIKISYSCTRNIAAKIAQHNAKVLGNCKPKEMAGCNCKKK